MTLAPIKRYADIHHHLDTLGGLVQFRGKLQDHVMAIEDYLKMDGQFIVSVAFYVNFYQDFKAIKDMISRFTNKLSRYGEDVCLIKNKSDLSKNFKVGVLYHVESGRALKNIESNLHELFDLGVRGVIPMHFIDNHLGNSCDDPLRRFRLKSQDNGVTKEGERFIKNCNELSMWVDLSHTTDKTGEDFLKLSKHVMISHVGIRDHVNLKRNKSLEFMRKVAAKKGIIGLSPWKHLCGSSLDDFVSSVELALENGLENAISFGSDMGAPIAAAKEIKSVASLSSYFDNEKFLYKNAYDFFEKTLPS